MFALTEKRGEQDFTRYEVTYRAVRLVSGVVNIAIAANRLSAVANEGLNCTVLKFFARDSTVTNFVIVVLSRPVNPVYHLRGHADAGYVC